MQNEAGIASRQWQAKSLEQLVETVQSLFSVGRNNQYDLIQAQLQQSSLEDRLSKIEQKINIQHSKLSRWIGRNNSNKKISDSLPNLNIPLTSSYNNESENISPLKAYFDDHPKIKEINTQLEIKQKEIQLVKASYKPGWALNVSYGYRADNPNGQSRSDFISAGVVMDLPMFTANRQDKRLLSKEYAFQALKDQRIDILQQLETELQQEITNVQIYKKRHQLYVKLLLPQVKQLQQAALLSYQSDKGIVPVSVRDLN